MAKYDTAVAECNAKSEALVHAEAELERLEEATSTAEGKSALYLAQLRKSKEKNKELVAELRFAENRIFELQEGLERDLQAEAEMAYDKTDEGYDEATGVESGRTYTPEFRARVLKLLALRVPVASIVPVLQATRQLPVEEKPPSLWWIYNMRRELSVVVLILAASLYSCIVLTPMFRTCDGCRSSPTPRQPRASRPCACASSSRTRPAPSPASPSARCSPSRGLPKERSGLSTTTCAVVSRYGSLRGGRST